MYRRVLVGGLTAAAIIGAGTTALAVTGADTTSGTPTATPTAKDHPKGEHKGKGGHKGKLGKLLRHLEHGQIVTKGKDGEVTHDLIAGTVTSVSSSLITVQAEDKKIETFSVTKDTKIRVRADGKGSTSTISKVIKGDHVLVIGIGTSTLTAKRILDVGKK